MSTAPDDRFFYDEEAAERPIRFVRRYLRLSDGAFAGQPFKLIDWQADLIRTLFGWKRKSDGTRRYRELYLLTAKGSGKTPLIASIGCYMLLADSEPAALVISAATNYQQALLTLNAGRGFISSDDTLGRMARVMQFEIRVPETGSQWTAISGTATGRQGLRPSCLLLDEAHEWPSGELYENLTAALPKRRQPLTCVATNAGRSQSCFAWSLHERALKALRGEGEPSLLAIVHEAPIDLDWTSEAAAKAANPSLGHIYEFDRLETEIAKAKASPHQEAIYRQLYLSQWQGADAEAWIDIADWDRCVTTDPPPASAALYVGLDLAQCNDLSAATFVYVTPGRMWIRAKFWRPQEAAERDELKHGIPYSKWASEGWIELLKSRTVNSAAHQAIASAIIKAGTPQAVLYDRYKASECIAILSAAGLQCAPIGQGYSLSPGMMALETAILDGEAAIEPNPILRWNAQNTILARDERGNTWPRKPGATASNNAGRRHLKIDGITAAASALVLAHKHTWPKPQITFSIGLAG